MLKHPDQIVSVDGDGNITYKWGLFPWPITINLMELLQEERRLHSLIEAATAKMKPEDVEEFVG